VPAQNAAEKFHGFFVEQRMRLKHLLLRRR
jgi:hypothetical protein